MKVKKIYCENCRHFKKSKKLFWVPIILVIIGLVTSISTRNMEYLIGLSALATPVSLMICLVIWSQRKKHCHLGLEKRIIEDTPAQRYEYTTTLTEDDLNKNNDCKGFEEK